jgi:hypothetical protein
MKAYLKVGVETGVGGECDRIRFESNGQEFQIKEDPIRNGLVIQSDEPLTHLCSDIESAMKYE